MSLSALRDLDGRPVDWWFVYKLPRGIGPKKKSSGDEFLYCDGHWNSTLHLSQSQMNDERNPVARTLQQLFAGNSKPGYVLWNDEIPPTRAHPRPSNNHSKGHSKGVLAFDEATNSGFYLLHSTPRFPAVGQALLPDDERDYGQTFLCVTLDYSTVLKLAEIIRIQHEPQVYAFANLPTNAGSPLSKLARHEHGPLDPKHPLIADFSFHSKERNDFRLFAKNRRWSEPSDQREGKDFWNHLVGPALRDRIDVETWRRGEVFGNLDPATNNVTLDVLGINLESIGYPEYHWPFTKDHAKWGSTEHRPLGLLLRHPGFVVIADINRDESQARRGGGGIAFQHDGIWRALKNVKKVDSTVKKTAHRAGQGVN